MRIDVEFKEQNEVIETNFGEVNYLPNQEGLLPGDNIEIFNNRISVLTTSNVEKDNTRPITSAGVYVHIGNIETLLGTI